VPGKGVGLASVKSIIETYNGTIWVESELGKGSTFRFTINGKFVGLAENGQAEATITTSASQDEDEDEDQESDEQESELNAPPAPAPTRAPAAA
jgi:hypothetical protein